MDAGTYEDTIGDRVVSVMVYDYNDNKIKKLTKEELLKLTGGDAIDSILSSNGNGSKDLCSTLTCDEGCVENCKKGCKPSCKNESKYGVDLG